MQVDFLEGGPWAEYEVAGSVVRVGGEGGIAVDLSAIQSDVAVTLFICRDAAGNLVQGTSKSAFHVAAIVVPPQERSERPKFENGEPVLDERGHQVWEVVVAPLNMHRVRLSLWPLGEEAR